MTTAILHTDDNDCDGYIGNGNNACLTFAINNSSSMKCGYDGVSLCFTDGLGCEYRAYMSFPTKTLTGCVIITAVLHYYVASITKNKGFAWNAALNPRLQWGTAKDHIGDSLDISDYGIATDGDVAVPGSTGWKTITITSSIYTDGDTDIELDPNADWINDLQATTQKYVLEITTNEGGANKPYLVIDYINNKGRKKKIRLFPRPRMIKQRVRGGING